MEAGETSSTERFFFECRKQQGHRVGRVQESAKVQKAESECSGKNGERDVSATSGTDFSVQVSQDPQVVEVADLVLVDRIPDQVAEQMVAILVPQMRQEIVGVIQPASASGHGTNRGGCAGGGDVGP